MITFKKVRSSEEYLVQDDVTGDMGHLCYFSFWEYFPSADINYLGSSDLRVIADKLDKLNKRSAKK